MALNLTVADVIAHLSQYPSDTKILTMASDSKPGHLCFQANCPNGVFDNLMPVIWPNEDGDGAEFSSGAGEIQPLSRVEGERWDMTGEEFVAVTVSNDSPTPPDANPFHFDAWSMGSPLVRGWTVMHEGFDRKENPQALLGMVLHNARSGQRIRLQFHPIERPDSLSGWTCPSCKSCDNVVSQDGAIRECLGCGYDFRHFKTSEPEQEPAQTRMERAVANLAKVPEWANDILLVVGDHHHFGSDFSLGGDEGHMIYGVTAGRIMDRLFTLGYKRIPHDHKGSDFMHPTNPTKGLRITYTLHGENGKHYNVSWIGADWL